MFDTKIEIKNMSMVRQSGIITNENEPIPDQYQAVIAECVLQVIYNLAVQSKVDINYDMYVNGTKYLIQGTDVTIVPPNADSYKRRIKNDRSLVNNHSKGE